MEESSQSRLSEEVDYCGENEDDVEALEIAEQIEAEGQHVSQADETPSKKRKITQPISGTGTGMGSNLTAAACLDNELCMDALDRMMIVDGLPFNFVEGEGFRYFMGVLQPLFNVPSKFTVAGGCYKLYMTERNRLKHILSKNLQHVSLSVNCWKSVQNLDYMCITVHFIDSDWNYQKRMINFCQISDLKGDTIKLEIEKKLLEWNIEKVFSITTDNATSNDDVIAYLKRRINAWKKSVLNCELFHMRCCAHILNSIVMDGLEDVNDSIVKIRNVVRYVRSSPSRLQKFKRCAKYERIQCESLVSLDVSTRWNSTYIMLESALKFRSAFERLEETSGDFLLEFGGESERKKGPPSVVDWEVATKSVRFLRIFHDVTLDLSASSHVTSNLYLLNFASILNALNKWCDSDDLVFRSMAEKMKKNYDKYWGSIHDMNLLILVASVLDPRYKMKFVEFACVRFYDQATSYSLTIKVRNTLCRLFEHYRLAYGVPKKENGSIGSSSLSKEIKDDSLTLSTLFELEMKEKEENKTEVEIYLAEAREKKSDNFDILNWWKVNSSKYPVLALVARDVLAVPMSAVTSESAFNTGERVLDSYKSSLSPEIVEALVCAQNWFRKTPLPNDMVTPDEAEEISKELAQVSKELGNLEI